VEALAANLGRAPAQIVADALAQYDLIREPALWPAGPPAGGTAPHGPSESPEFVRFYEHAYPRKVARGAARRAWASAIRKADPGVILAAAERFRPDPRYVPHPATWLNGERWRDDPGVDQPGTVEHGTWQ
jgi:hypothetical protein